MDSESEKLTLTPADAAAADALLNGEPGGDPERQQRVEGWLHLLDTSPMPEAAGDLVARTLAAVQADRMKLPAARDASPGETAAHPVTASRWRRRLAEVGAMAVAAMLLLAVTIEGLGTARVSAKRVACQANLKLFTTAFANYASQGGDGVLPMLAAPANGSWMHGNAPVGGTAAMNNAANLLPLLSRDYIPVKALFCPGAGLPEGPVEIASNQVPGIGYSYRDMTAPDKPKWDRQHATIILTDKNPVFGTITRPELAERNSANHEGKGSYVLRADTSVTWETHPNIGPNRDNIWTIGTGKDRLTLYTGREAPAGLFDVFVCP